ncbi:hypothetical protein CHISP_1787 [Chitinispirillum alkaliphilum]|nr:hypothetical protein CHISP_1787 [Chitinispirillum alkaliphilum]
MGSTIKTNKATLTITSEKVHKKYFRKGNAERDFFVLKQIDQSFEHTKYNEKLYRPIFVHGYDPETDTLIMEFFEGNNIQEIYMKHKKPDVFKFMGTWLGLMHSKCKTSKRQVPAFRDYNCSNVMMNNYEVVSVDPGYWMTLYENPGISFVTGAFSIWRSALLNNPKSTFACIRCYIKEYKTHFSVDFFSVANGVMEIMKRMYNNKTKVFCSKKNNVVKVFFMFMETIPFSIVLWMTYICTTTKKIAL